MFHKLNVLTKLQLSEKLKWNKSDSASHKAGIIAKTIGGMALVYGVFCALFYVIFSILGLFPSRDLFTFFILLMSIISIVTCTVQSIGVLYTSKDNFILLTYPVKHSMIYVSKLCVMYILELLRSLTLVLPLFMAYMTMIKGVYNVNYLVSAIAYSFILPLIPVLLGSILSIPFVYLTKIIKKANWIKTIFSVLLFAALIVGTLAVVQFIEANSPIRLTALWNKFNNDLVDFCSKFNKYGTYCYFVGKAMYTSDINVYLPYHILTLIFIIVVMVISVLISLPSFYRLASSASENATQKQHKGVNKVHKSTFFTFIRKELTISFRSLDNFASDYVFLFAMPFILILITAIFVNIPRVELGYSFTYGFICLISLVILCASNTASATAISSEGNEFVLFKTAPGKTSNIIWAKLIINFIISFIMTALSFGILFIILAPDIAEGLLDPIKLAIVFVYDMIIEIGLLCWSIQLDIVNPKLREFANSQNKAEIKNSSQSIIIGLVASVIFAALSIVLFITRIPTLIIGGILVGAALIFTLLRLYFLIIYRNAFFEDIQL